MSDRDCPEEGKVLGPTRRDVLLAAAAAGASGFAGCFGGDDSTGTGTPTGPSTGTDTPEEASTSTDTPTRAATDTADAVTSEPTSDATCAVSGIPELLVNQTGYDIGRTKRFTAPGVADGTAFEIIDSCGGSSRYSATVSGGVGDFSDFDPNSEGPYQVRLTADGTTVYSDPFLVDDHLTERASYRQAVEFFTGSRLKSGDFGQLWDDPDDWEITEQGFAWRDQPGFTFLLRSLVNMYRSNPAALEAIHVSSDDLPPDLDSGGYDYTNMPTSVPADTPEIVRLIWWGAEVYYKANVNYTMQKNDLAAFLAAYPELSEWIPRETYTRCRDHLFDVWTRDTGTYQNIPGRYYTNHSRNLFTTYDQVGTSKGEFPPGFSIAGNLDMYRVAIREERSDAHEYLRAARDQVEWIVDNVDETMPITTKGQRPNEFVTVSNVVRFVREHPDDAPDGTRAWISRWATEMVARSDNMWDFRKWDEDTWVDQQLPEFPSERINEPGNVAGFPAPALAAATVLDDVDPSLAGDLRVIARSHVDNTFGRNPTGRHFSHRATESGYAWDGADRGWYSEYCGGRGGLCGVRGVLDGSPKNDHYPDNPDAGDIGWTEGWTQFNAAFNMALAWLSFDDSDLSIRDADGEAVTTVGSSDTVTLALRVARDTERSDTNETVDVRLRVGDDAWQTVTLAQTTATGPWYEADVDLGSQGVSSGDEITVRYGSGPYRRTATATVGSSRAVVVDSEDDVGVKVTGRWVAETDKSHVGDHYKSDGDANKGSKRIEFTPDLPVAGSYDVFLYWAAGSDRTTAAPVEITHAGGTDTVTVDQTANGGQFTLVGTYDFTGGTRGSIAVKNDGTSGVVVADAVKFVVDSTFADDTAPDAPSRLSTAGVDSSSATVGWSGVTDGETGVHHYNVYVNGSTYAETAAGTTRTTVTGLRANTTYDIAVTAVDVAGNESSTSNVLAVTTDESKATKYPIDRGSGRTLVDDSGNGRDGTISGAAWGTDSGAGGANDVTLSFGSGDAVETPDDHVRGADEYTVIAWAKLDDLAGDSVLLGDWGQSDPSLLVRYDAGNDCIQAVVRNADGTEYEISDTGVSPPLGSWVQVALTFDADQTVRLFQNGEKTGSTIVANGIPINDGTPGRRIGADYGVHSSWRGEIHSVFEWPERKAEGFIADLQKNW